MNHPLDVAIALDRATTQRFGSPEDNDHARLQIFAGQPSDQYANFVGPFGGASAATLIQAVLSHTECVGDPVALTVNFSTPVKPDGFDITVELMQAGGITQHWLVMLKQEGSVACTATAVTARRRPSWSETEATAPRVPLPAELEPLDVRYFPIWVRQYDIRSVTGGVTPGGQPRDHSESVFWIRDNPRRDLDFPSLTALCDAFFPRVFVRTQKMAPIGTVSMTVHFHCRSETLASIGSEHVLARAQAQCFHDSFFDQAAQIWSPEGQMLATTNQIVFFKDVNQ